MKKRNKPRYSLLLLLLLFISLGYALLQSNLNINGIAEIEDSKWDIHWDNVQIKEGSVSTSNANKATINSSKTIVSYNITLDKPGDFYEFTVDAVNEGTIDAMIDTISSKMNGAEITTLPEYLEYSVTYSDGVELQPNQELKIDTSEKYKVRIAFKKNINASQLPTEPVELNMVFIVNYKQATDDAIEVEHPIMVYTFPFRNSVKIGQEIPDAVTQYSSAEEAINDFKEDMEDDTMNYCFKHTIVNGIVTESYIVFVIDSRIVAENPSAKVGTYEVKYSPPESINDNNIAIMQEAFGSNKCNRSQYNSFTCSIYYGETSFFIEISDIISNSSSRLTAELVNQCTRCTIENGSAYCDQW